MTISQINMSICCIALMLPNKTCGSKVDPAMRASILTSFLPSFLPYHLLPIRVLICSIYIYRTFKYLAASALIWTRSELSYPMPPLLFPCPSPAKLGVFCWRRTSSLFTLQLCSTATISDSSSVDSCWLLTPQIVLLGTKREGYQL